MARFAALGLGLAGAALGSFIGMPQLGFLAGSLLGNILFPAKGPVIEGPRLGDLSVTSSAYGASRAIGYGTIRQGGNIVWSMPIEEHRHKQKQGGKGSVMGGSSATNVTYSYYGNFAIAFGEGPAEDVLRIWADGKLIFDKSGTGTQVSKATLKFRFYPGNETQLPDPLIVADKGANTPAYRGTVLIVFEDLPLQDYGNRLPTITAEIAYRRTSPLIGDTIDFAAGAGGYQRNGIAVDWNRTDVYVEGSGGAYASGTLTFSGQPSDTNTVTIGGTTYTFKTTLGAVAYQVHIGATLALTVANLQAAIADTGVEGTDYGTGTVEHTTVQNDYVNSTSTTLVVTAKTAGVAGNSIATTESGSQTSWGNVTLTGGTDGNTLLYTMDIETRQETRRVEVFYGDDVYNMGLLCAIGNGTLLMKGPGSGNSSQISRVDPTSGAIMGTFGRANNATDNDVNQFSNVVNAIPVVAPGPFGPVYYVMTMSFNGHWGLLKPTEMVLSPAAAQLLSDDDTEPCPGFMHEGQSVVGSFDSTPMCTGAFGVGYGDAYVGVVTGSQLTIRKVRVYWNATPTIPVEVATDVWEIQVGTGIEISDVVDLNATLGLTGSFRTLWYDRTDDTVIALTSAGDFVKWSETLGLVWQTTAAIGSSDPDERTGGQSSLDAGRVGWMILDTSYLYDTRDGTLIVSQANWDSVNGDDVFGDQFYNGENNQVIYVGTSGGDLNMAFLDRSTRDGESLATIVEDICERVGLVPADINVTALTEEVKGFLIGRQTSARSCLEILAKGFFFDGIESDWQLKFIHRSGTPTLDIPEADLKSLAGKNGETVRESRIQELELPETVHVTYYDVTNDYQQGEQHFKRIREPHPTMYSENVVSVELPIVFDATEALAVVERALIQAWVERTSIEIATSQRYLLADPGDNVTVTLENGTVYTVRLTKVDCSADLGMAMQASATDSTSYSATGATGDGGDINDQEVSVTQSSKLFVLNTPLLRDSDDAARTSGVSYAAAAGYLADQDQWKGATVFRNYDPSNYQAVTRLVNPVTWGSCANELGDCVPQVTDVVNELTIYLVNEGDGLETITNLTMLTALNGENAAAVGHPDRGWEIIQFQNATQNADGTWTIDTLLRGRRGTEHLVGGHRAGDFFVLLTPDVVEGFGVPLADADRVASYRAVSSGQVPEDVEYIGVLNEYNDLKPYSPAALHATYSGTDIILTWARRTRVGGAWKDGGAEVPMAEDSEEYELEIYTVDGTELRRTVTGLETPIYTYSVTNMSSDDLDPDNRAVDYFTLTNPGAETGDTTGWTVTSGTWIADNASPIAGVYSFRKTNIGGADLYQDCTLSGAQLATVATGAVSAVMTAVTSSGSLGGGDLRMSFYDASNVLISEITTTVPADSGTIARELIGACPVNTAKIRTHLLDLHGGGSTFKFDTITVGLATGTTTPSALNVKVYQISAQVGRGIAAEEALSIHDSA